MYPTNQNYNFFICIPPYVATGGITLAFSMIEKLRRRGYKVSLFFNPRPNPAQNPIPPLYDKYNANYVNYIPDNPNSFIITTEINIDMLQPFRHAKKAIWWMSFDFYWDSKKKAIFMKNIFLHTLYKYLHNPKTVHYYFKNKNILHLSQCAYIEESLIKYGIKKNKIVRLSDFIDPLFNINDTKVSQKENIVLYNPKKGFEFTRTLIALSKKIKWIPIERMTPLEVRNLMLKSKVYIDFGFHPGKDRIPREAALCGCCVITGRKGAAANEFDIPIPPEFKFNDTIESASNIISLIESIFDNYEKYNYCFNGYREIIRNEEKIFEKELDHFIETINSNY